MQYFIQTPEGFKEIKDLRYSTPIYRNNRKSVCLSNSKEMECWKLTTDIGIEYLSAVEPKVPRAYFSSTETFSNEDDYGYYARGRLANILWEQNSIGIMGKDGAYRLIRSINCLDKNNVHLATKDFKANGYQISFPKIQNKIDNVNTMSENSLRWFLQGYFCFSNLSYRKISPGCFIFTFKKQNPFAYLIMRLANITIYYNEEFGPYIPCNEIWKILNIMPASIDITFKQRKRHNNAFPEYLYKSALRWKGVSKIRYNNIIKKEKVRAVMQSNKNMSMNGYYTNCDDNLYSRFFTNDTRILDTGGMIWLD